LLILGVSLGTYFTFGGGEAYKDVSTDPIYQSNQLEEVFASP
jgi:hypothetical protein